MNKREEALIRKIDRERRHHPKPVISQLWEQFQKEIFQNPDYAVLETGFIAVYGREAVQRDLQMLEARQLDFVRNQTPIQEKLAKTSSVLEGLIAIHAEQSDWLGPEAKTLKASNFDDVFHGVDMYVEWGGSRQRTIALGIERLLASWTR